MNEKIEITDDEREAFRKVWRKYYAIQNPTEILDEFLRELKRVMCG